MATPERVYTGEWEDYLRTYQNKPQSTVALPTGQGSVRVTREVAEKLHETHKNVTPQAYNTLDLGFRATSVDRESYKNIQEILNSIFGA